MPKSSTENATFKKSIAGIVEWFNSCSGITQINVLDCNFRPFLYNISSEAWSYCDGMSCNETSCTY